MEELADAIEDAQYVNAIAAQDDGPRPLLAWEKPDSAEELQGWIDNKLKKVDTFTWICEQEIGYFLFSSYVKEIYNDYARMNFCEEILRYKKTQGRTARLEKAYIIATQFLGYETTRLSEKIDDCYQWPVPPRTEIEETTLARNFNTNHNTKRGGNTKSSGGSGNTSSNKIKPTSTAHASFLKDGNTNNTSSANTETTLSLFSTITKQELDVMYTLNHDYPTCTESPVGIKGPILNEIIQDIQKAIDNSPIKIRKNKVKSNTIDITSSNNNIQQQREGARDNNNNLSTPSFHHRSAARNASLIAVYNNKNNNTSNNNINSLINTSSRSLDRTDQVVAALEALSGNNKSTHSQTSNTPVSSSSFRNLNNANTGGSSRLGFHLRKSSNDKPFEDFYDEIHAIHNDNNDNDNNANNNNNEDDNDDTQEFEGDDDTHVEESIPPMPTLSRASTEHDVTSSSKSKPSHNDNNSTNKHMSTSLGGVLTSTSTNKVGGMNIINSSSGNNNYSLSRTVFDKAEYICMESLKRQYFITFQQSDYWIKLMNFLWYQDRRVIPEDFFTMRVLGRGGFGLVTACKKGTSGKLYAMKVMNKRRIKMKKSELLALNERQALAAVESKFVINLKYSFHSKDDVYLILDLMTGGDLGYHLQQRGRFSEKECLYYAARIMLGLQALHDEKYVYRDLKPENCLLADDGRVKITDLGLATKIVPNLHGAAGTRGYWAPEMLRRDSRGKRMTYDHTVDWFSFGCCIAEFISGTNPFRSDAALKFGLERGKQTKEKAIDCATLEMNPEFPSERHFEPEAADLCRRLLDKNEKTRLGKDGCGEIMAHPWFKSVNWESVISDRKKPPFIPAKDVNAASQSEIGTFAEDKAYQETVITESDDEIYKDWDWTNPHAFAAEVIEFLIYERITGEPLLPITQNASCCCTIL